MARTTVEDRLQKEIDRIDAKIRSIQVTIEELQQERQRLVLALEALRR